VRVVTPEGVDPRPYKGRVMTRPGTINWKVLEKDLARLYELGDWKVVDFRIEDEDGRQTLVYYGLQKPPAPGASVSA